MEIKEILRRLRGLWLLVLIASILGALAGLGVATLTPKQYTATTQVFMSTQTGDGSSTSDVSQVQLKSYATAVTSDLILDPASKAANRDRDDLEKSLAVQIPDGTSIIQISATATDAQVAATSANSVAKALQVVSPVLYPTTTKGNKAIKSTLLSAAPVPTTPSLPHKPMNIAVGFVLGLLLGALAAVSLGGRRPRARLGEKHLSVPRGAQS